MSLHKQILQTADFEDHNAKGELRTLIAYYDYEPETDGDFFTPSIGLDVKIYKVMLFISGRNRNVTRLLKQETIETMKEEIESQILED